MNKMLMGRMPSTFLILIIISTFSVLPLRQLPLRTVVGVSEA
jgi:hypothetical protein